MTRAAAYLRGFMKPFKRVLYSTSAAPLHGNGSPHPAEPCERESAANRRHRATQCSATPVTPPPLQRPYSARLRWPQPPPHAAIIAPCCAPRSLEELDLGLETEVQLCQAMRCKALLNNIAPEQAPAIQAVSSPVLPLAKQMRMLWMLSALVLCVSSCGVQHGPWLTLCCNRTRGIVPSYPAQHPPLRTWTGTAHQGHVA